MPQDASAASRGVVATGRQIVISARPFRRTPAEIDPPTDPRERGESGEDSVHGNEGSGSAATLRYQSGMIPLWSVDKSSPLAPGARLNVLAEITIPLSSS